MRSIIEQSDIEFRVFGVENVRDEEQLAEQVTAVAFPALSENFNKKNIQSI